MTQFNFLQQPKKETFFTVNVISFFLGSNSLKH